MATAAFTLESMVRGYHLYCNVWDAAINEVLPCERELNNRKDPFAVAVVKSGVGTVGHVPRLISSVCSIFIRRGGSIACRVTGSRRYSRDLSQGGVEIPCQLIFEGPVHDTNKVERLLHEVLPLAPAGTSNMSDLPVCNDKPALAVQTDAVPAVIVIGSEDNAATSKKRKFTLLENDFEDLIMGKRLTQDHIYYAQELLKTQFPTINGLHSTLLQNKPVTNKEDLKDKLQIVHCNGNHWIAASNIKCDADCDVAIYDSIYRALNDEAETVICNLFQVGKQKPKIKVMNCQKQIGGMDCGLFAVAFITSIAHGQEPAKLQYLQDEMRNHLVKCFKAQKMEPFPCK
uniref:Ubiquitin-like protease family profile domain-containing protein n=1 Tax=Amphimedon queenslandica TaxID=400682 RepID=A0A1X7V3B4_AMPQE